MRSVVFLGGCDTDIIKNHTEALITKVKSACEIPDACVPVAISSKRQLTSLTRVHGYPEYFVTLCRKYGLLKNDRVTLLSPMDQMVSIQLCLAEKNKQETGDYDVESSVVLQAVKDINNQKLVSDYDVTSCTQESGICELYEQFLTTCNCVDAGDVYGKLKAEHDGNDDVKADLADQVFLVLDVPKSQIEKAMLEFLCSDSVVRLATVEVPLDSEDDLTVTCRDNTLETILATDACVSTVKKPPSMTEAFVHHVYLSYLELVVNSRSELALARVFNVPERELTHQAFTDLKHEAQQKKMTMYQTVTSYVMKIRLGGKGYAPDLTSSLAQNIKGLGELVSLMHRMETVLEEDPDMRSGCRRVINIIRREIIKCKDSRIRKASVESVGDMLQDRISDVIDSLDSSLFKTPDKAPANGGSLTSRRARKAIRHLLDKLATGDDDMSVLDHLTDIYSSQRTPIRFQSLLSQFRSPDEELEETSPDNKYTSSLSERVMNRVNKQTPVYAKRYKSTMDWAEPVHKMGLQENSDVFSNSQVYVIPSKTIVHAGSKYSSGEANKVLESLMDQENLPGGDIHLAPVSNTSKPTTSIRAGKQQGEKKKQAAEKQSKKRPAESDTQSSQPQKKKKTDQSKSCRRKLLPQVKGQKSLTSFFRV